MPPGALLPRDRLSDTVILSVALAALQASEGPFHELLGLFFVVFDAGGGGRRKSDFVGWINQLIVVMVTQLADS